MNDIEKFDEVARNAWRESVRAERKRKLSSNLVADIWMVRRRAIEFDSQIYEWINLQRELLDQTHPTDDVDSAERALRKIAREIRKRPSQQMIKVVLSGIDILALEQIIVEPSGWVGGDAIDRHAMARSFLNRAANAYLRNPNYPEEKGSAWKAVKGLKHGFLKKANW